jgi:HSP20 family protein
MAIQRWNPLRDLRELQGKMNRLFDDTLSRSAGAEDSDAAAGRWKPPIDLFEEERRYVLRADLPGVTASDVELEVTQGTLYLRGERKLDGVAREAYLRVERPSGPFEVRVALPPSVDPSTIEASHEGGVLQVVLPKRKRDPQDQLRIEVKGTKEAVGTDGERR